MTGLPRLFVVSLVASIALISCTKRGDSRRVAACGTFEGGKMSALWTDCPDKVRREVRCAPFIDQLKCDCYEDGVSKWFFNASDPPLASREDATRVANKNCHWSLETP